MSRQQRGNELGPGAAGTGSRDAHDRCTLSFVPINKPYPDLQHPDLQHPDTARDSDESHETNINTQQAVPKKRGRKPLPKRPLPCAVSLGPVRDYEDEGDTSVQNSGPGFQAAISKQRKAMPAKRTVNMEPTLEHAMQSQDNKLNALCEGQQGPKMPVPSDSTKRKRRETSTLSVEGEKQTKLFENPAIVKVAASSSAKAKTVDTVTTTNISYRGWNATQDTLKSSPNTLTPTTLQKLAAFRHKTPGTQRNSQSPSHGTAQSIHSPELRLVSSRSRTLPTSSDHREFSLSARFFDDASRVTDRTADQSGLPYDQGLPYAKVDESETMHNDLKASDRSKVPYKQQRLDHGTRQGRPNSIKITDSKSTPLDEFEEPTSSECAKLNNLVGTQCSRVDDNAGQHETDTLMGFQQCHPESNTVPTGSYEMPSKIIGSNQRLGEISYDHPALFGDTEVRIQVPQLCPGTSQSIPHQKLDKDNFSDGLDDDDFLALASTPIVAVPLNNDPVMNEAGNLDKTHDGHHLTSMSSSNSPSSSIEDEFPDSDLEEVMLHLPDAQHHGTKETFAPPSELKFATENDSVNQEVYDSNLKFSPPGSSGSIESTQQGTQGDAEATDCVSTHLLETSEDWEFLRTDGRNQRNPAISKNKEPRGRLSTTHRGRLPHNTVSQPSALNTRIQMGRSRAESSSSRFHVPDDSHEYLPLKQFARSNLPAVIRDRSPIIGLSGQQVLRVCFRIGELIKEGSRCTATGQEAIFELFARVTFSSRETGTTKQHFQFADLFHDHPPFPNGVLPNYKSSGLAESESKVFLARNKMMARCLGRVLKDKKNMCWRVDIINIRPTDWEEIRWTKRIVSDDNTGDVMES